MENTFQNCNEIQNFQVTPVTNNFSSKTILSRLGEIKTVGINSYIMRKVEKHDRNHTSTGKEKNT